jgi:hypothetical protein
MARQYTGAETVAACRRPPKPCVGLGRRIITTPLQHPEAELTLRLDVSLGRGLAVPVQHLVDIDNGVVDTVVVGLFSGKTVREVELCLWMT